MNSNIELTAEEVKLLLETYRKLRTADTVGIENGTLKIAFADRAEEVAMSIDKKLGIRASGV